MDLPPAANWLTVFNRELPSLRDALALDEVTVEHDRILVSGAVVISRAITVSLRA